MLSSLVFGAASAAGQQLLMGSAERADRHDWALASQLVWLAAAGLTELALHFLFAPPAFLLVLPPPTSQPALTVPKNSTLI